MSGCTGWMLSGTIIWINTSTDEKDAFIAFPEEHYLLCVLFYYYHTIKQTHGEV